MIKQLDIKGSILSITSMNTKEGIIYSTYYRGGNKYILGIDKLIKYIMSISDYREEEVKNMLC